MMSESTGPVKRSTSKAKTPPAPSAPPAPPVPPIPPAPAAPPVPPAPAAAPPVPPAPPAPPAPKPVKSAPPAPAQAETQVLSTPPAPAPAAAPSPYYPPAAPPFGPVLKGNRGFGSFIALIGTLLFAAAFVAVPYLVLGPALFEGSLLDVLVGALGRWGFWLPVAAFLLSFLLFVLIANRSGIGAWLLGSLLVGIAVLFAFNLGSLLDSFGFQVPWGSEEANTVLVFGFGLSVAAALIAREIALWLGAIVGARGRRVKAANAKTKAEFEAGAGTAA